MVALDPPKQILHQPEAKFALFLWVSTASQPRRHWRCWHRQTLPLNENGLAVRKLDDVVDSFACKKWWKLINHAGIWATYVISSLPNVWAYKAKGRMAEVRNLML